MAAHRHYMIGNTEPTAGPMQPGIKLTLSWPPRIQAEIPIKAGTLKSLARLFTFARVSERLLLVGATLELTVSEDDSGRLTSSLIFANFCLRRVLISSLHIDHVSVGNGSLSDFNPHMEKPEVVVPRRGVAELAFTHRIGAAEIRHLQHVIGAPNSKLSSPLASTGLVGSIQVHHWRGVYPVTFGVASLTPFLNFYNPSSRALGA